MFNEELHYGRKLRWGIVGGGRGSKTGYIHRTAAMRDRLFDFSCGAFETNFDNSQIFGQNIGLSDDRIYRDYREMFEKEAQRDDGMEVVSILTPSFTHYEICLEALNMGFHVICENPISLTLRQAQELLELSERKKLVVGMTYGYTGVQIIHEARNIVKNGDIGDIRVIQMQFAHGAEQMISDFHDKRIKLAFKPCSFVLGDIGTHALFLAETMVPSLKIDRLLCTKQSFVKKHAPLEDNATVLFEFKGGAVGTMWLSAINTGAIGGQKIRIIGSKGSVEWQDDNPNQIKFEQADKPLQILTRAMKYLHNDDDAVSMDRISAGHAEGEFESWSNLYRRFGIAIHEMNNGNIDFLNEFWYPSVKDGVRGVKFIKKCIESSDNGSTWVKY